MGYRWEVRDDQRLVELVAKLLAGRSAHVARILRSAPTVDPRISASTRARWITVLRSAQPGTPAVYHRDGLLFQLISWIAAFRTYATTARIRPPQVILAHKGVDNLVLAAEGSPATSPLRIVVCEDKASENPRSTIRDDVWPALVEYETGARDHELIAEITMMLSDLNGDNLDSILDALFATPKCYRVCLALDSDPTPTLFSDYELTISGADATRRRGEYLRTPRPLREWTQQLAERIADHLAQLP
jgi:hypothetical protein